MGKSTYRQMFGSSDESDDSVGNGKDDVSASTDINTRGIGTSADINTRSVGTSADTNARGVVNSIDTTQEALDRKVLRLAPDRKPLMLCKHLLDRWSGKTNERFSIPLFDASRIHGLDASAKNFHTENDRYIDAFLEHRWYAHTKGVRPTRSSNLGTRSSPTFQTLGWKLGFGN